MHVGQPIWWVREGQQYFGIVKEELPCRAGVLAYFKTVDGMAVVKVRNPHKIREGEWQKKVLLMYKDLPEATAHVQTVIQQYHDATAQAFTAAKEGKAPVVQAPVKQEPPKLPADDQPLTIADILGHDLTVADHIMFYGLGLDLDGAEQMLPKADPNTTPIDKMYYR